jgi:hypothetical protein
VGVDAGVVERCPGERHVHQTGSQPGRRIGEFALPDADEDGGVAFAVGGGQSGAGLFRAVGQDTDGDGVGTGCRGHPGTHLVGLCQKRPCLAVQGDSGGGESHSGGRAAQQRTAEVGLQVFDGPTERRLRHVQPCGGTAEVEFLGDCHEVSQPV